MCVCVTDCFVTFSQLEASSECLRAAMRMSQCSLCQGLSDVKPCAPFCLNVLKGCLAYHADLGVDWDNYVGESFTILSSAASVCLFVSLFVSLFIFVKTCNLFDLVLFVIA